MWECHSVDSPSHPNHPCTSSEPSLLLSSTSLLQAAGFVTLPLGLHGHVGLFGTSLLTTPVADCVSQLVSHSATATSCTISLPSTGPQEPAFQPLNWHDWL